MEDNLELNLEMLEKLLNSKISGYQIEKETGVSRMTISNLRTGKTMVESLSLRNARKLSEFAIRKLNEKGNKKSR
ncbi:DNA-binding protein [Enterococcus faecalis]|nr:DNA-binding protein [Enterococcus faecalis]